MLRLRVDTTKTIMHPHCNVNANALPLVAHDAHGQLPTSDWPQTTPRRDDGAGSETGLVGSVQALCPAPAHRGMLGVAQRPFARIAGKSAVGFHVADGGFDRAAPLDHRVERPAPDAILPRGNAQHLQEILMPEERLAVQAMLREHGPK